MSLTGGIVVASNDDRRDVVISGQTGQFSRGYRHYLI